MVLHDLSALIEAPELVREYLKQADAATLLLVLVQLTGEEGWLHRAKPFVSGPTSYHETMPETMRQEIRDRLFEVLTEYARSGETPPPVPEGDLLAEMLSFAAGEAVSGDYPDMVREDMQADEFGLAAVNFSRPPPPNFNVVIIGAGMSGICAAIRLQQAGVQFTVVEKNEALGGTWFENNYPGCGVDTPNHFYSYSFEPAYSWSRLFSKRDELWQYFQDVADRHDLRARIQFSTEAISAVFDEKAGVWNVTTQSSDGSSSVLRANILVSAVGILNRPKIPTIPGQDTFRGATFHTAKWDQSFDWRGKRIGIIGTGASGHQVGPAIAEEVGSLTVFQRSPHWVVPNPNYFVTVSEGKKWAVSNIPYYSRWYRFQLFWTFADGLYPALKIDPEWPNASRSINQTNDRHRRFMENYIKSELGADSPLLPKVIPNYPPYGKRILIDNLWYRMLKRTNVELVTDQIREITSTGVKTEDGKCRPFDAIIYATGFQASKVLSPMTVKGVGGVDLHHVWGPDDAKAYLGMTVPAFPNFFMLLGPNTGLAHGGNAIFMTECQVHYLMHCIRELVDSNQKSMDVRSDVYDEYNKRVDDMHDELVWSHKGLTNWYRNVYGRVFALSPWRLVDYWKMTSHLRLEDYSFSPKI